MASIRKPLFDFGRFVDDNTNTVITNEKGDTAKYLIHSSLEQYWTHEKVVQILNLHTGEPLHVSIDTIRDRYLVIWSILVYNSCRGDSFRASDIALFIRSNLFDDHNLPLDRERALQIFTSSRQGQESWTLFDEHQYLFNPIRLGPKLLHDRFLLPKSIIPLECGEKISGREGNGPIVRKYTIKEGSGLKLAPGTTIAVKETPLRGPDAERTFTNEVEAYITLDNFKQSRPASKFFLNYYGSFKRNGKGYILLEYANEGSLDDFFSRNDIPFTREELYSLWKELLNLVRGLKLLHNLQNKSLNGIHQDLKPSNIFVFKNGDESSFKYSFKIGDFGLSSFRVREFTHSDNKCTKMYGAPELTNLAPDLAHLDEGVTPAADIWSLGCIFIDILVWQVCGDRGRTIFFNKRMEAIKNDSKLYLNGYLGAFHNGVERLGVIEETLKDVISSRRVFDDLTERLAQRILRKMLVLNAPDRLLANQLTLDLEHFLTDMEKNGDQAPGRAKAMSPGSTQLIEVGLANNAGHQPTEIPPVTPVRRQGKFGTIRHSPDNIDERTDGDSELPFANGGLYVDTDPPSHCRSTTQTGHMPVLRTPSDQRTIREPFWDDGAETNLPFEGPRNGSRAATNHSTMNSYGPNFANRQPTTSNHLQAHRVSEPPPPTSFSQSQSQSQDPGSNSRRPFSDQPANAAALLQVQYSQPRNDPPRARPQPPNPASSSSHSTIPTTHTRSTGTLAPGNSGSIGRHSSTRSKHSAPRSPVSYQEPNPTIKDVLDWKEKNKNKRKRLPGQNDADRVLDNREYIFIVDDSNSMVQNEPQWKEVQEAIEVLTYLVKGYDKTGIELYLTSSHDKPKKAPKKESSSLVAFLRKRNPSLSTPKTNMELSLNKILERANVLKGATDSRGRISELLLGSRNQTDVNIYILTNAMWGDDDKYGRPAVAQTIKNLVKQMKKNNRPRTSVMIQFIRFGDDPAAMRRLRYLDDELGKELELDIVDTKDTSSDVWQILIGSLDCSVDNTYDNRAQNGQPEGSNMDLRAQSRSTGANQEYHEVSGSSHPAWERPRLGAQQTPAAFTRHPECQFHAPGQCTCYQR